jgi:Cys-tRNA(Pro)/Cys-tRNA(Cys) deacylase
LRSQRRQGPALTVDSGEQIARAPAGLLPVVGGIARRQQPDTGVLVEFGGEYGDSVIAGDGAGRSQPGGKPRLDLNAQPYSLIVDRGPEPRQVQPLGRPCALGETLIRARLVSLCRKDPRAGDVSGHRVVDAAGDRPEAIAILQKPRGIRQVPRLVEQSAEQRAAEQGGLRMRSHADADLGRVAELVEGARVPHEVVKFDHDSRERSFGNEAVSALTEAGSIAAEQVHKTLIIAVPGGLAVAIVPVLSKLSLKAAAAALGAGKAAMADPAVAERTTGYVLGAVSPFGQRKRLPVVLDSSALGWQTMYCSAGRRGWDVAVAPQDLIRLTNAVTASLQA